MPRARDRRREIIDLEERLDRELPRPALAGAPRRELIAASAAWSAAIWEAARIDGPIVPGGDAVEWGLDVGRHPVFVCGSHRSGTTLVRDLLDGHPALVVLPSEGTVAVPPRRFARAAGPALDTIAPEWLRRLANPINRPPYWLLGRSDPAGSPYVGFARRLLGWWPVLQASLAREVACRPLVAVALAYACSRTACPAPGIRRWVEKTPTNERFLEALWRAFPRAKAVHVVREPMAVVASRKVLERAATGSFRTLHAVLRDLADGYRAAAAHAGDASGRYCLVRYEDLTGNPAASIARLAAFLEIAETPELSLPSVAGRPAASNTAFGARDAAGLIGAARAAPPGVLTAVEREHVAAAVGHLAAGCGYRVEPIGPWRARFLNATRRFTPGPFTG